jgi:hypothetical protein
MVSAALHALLLLGFDFSSPEQRREPRSGGKPGSPFLGLLSFWRSKRK